MRKGFRIQKKKSSATTNNTTVMTMKKKPGSKKSDGMRNGYNEGAEENKVWLGEESQSNLPISE
jgi:hypothetical protein